MALNINLFGHYGSGKGTQRKMLMSKYSLGAFEPGDIIRDEIEKKSERGIEMDTYISRGQLIPDAMIVEMVDEFFDTFPKDQGVVFDGVPRTMVQKMLFDQELKKYGREVINIDIVISDELSLQRQISRKEKRIDQNENIARARIKQFREFVLPVLKTYRDEGNMALVNGEQDVEKVFEDICKIVDDYGKRNQ